MAHAQDNQNLLSMDQELQAHIKSFPKHQQDQPANQDFDSPVSPRLGPRAIRPHSCAVPTASITRSATIHGGSGGGNSPRKHSGSYFAATGAVATPALVDKPLPTNVQSSKKQAAMVRFIFKKSKWIVWYCMFQLCFGISYFSSVGVGC